MSALKNIEKSILKMKDTSELMVDLAYSALLYNNKEIAVEVYNLEDRVDELYNRIIKFAVRNTAALNPDIAWTLIRLATSIEMIADSARGIADVVLRDIEPHPIVKLSIRESEAIISKVTVESGANIVNCTLGGIRLASETGMWVIAIRRGNKWLFGPDENTNVKPGDILIVRGPIEGEESIRKFAYGGKRRKFSRGK